MTDLQLRDEAMTLFMAGHETTANTLAWIWFLLSTHPEVEPSSTPRSTRSPPRSARRPSTTLPGWPTPRRSSPRRSGSIRRSGSSAARRSSRPRSAAIRCPVGTTVYMSQWVIHRDPRFFDDPLAYRPERWADGLAKKIHRYAYFPFGGGPRICIGNAFAMMEATLLLATIARRFRVKVWSAPTEVVPLPTMTLRPVGGIEVLLEARTRVDAVGPRLGMIRLQRVGRSGPSQRATIAGDGSTARRGISLEVTRLEV